MTPSHADHLQPRGAYADLPTLVRLRFVAQSLRLGTLRPVRSLLSGGERTRFRGRGMDFEEVRLYQPGDDVRTIDWRVTARTQVPHTKVFQEERERPVFIVVDQRSPLFFGSQCCFKSVLAAHIAALLAWAALTRGDRVGGLVLGDMCQRDIRPRRSRHAVLELLHQIHHFNRQLHSPLSEAGHLSLRTMLEDVRRLAKPGCAIFIVSDFHDLDAACEQQLFEISRHTDITMIHLYDPLERHLTSSAPLTISNGQTRWVLPADEKPFQQAWQTAYEENRQTLINSCRKLALPLLSFATSDDIHQLLRESYSAKPIRRASVS